MSRTVNLEVPHIRRAVQRHERIQMQDVLRVERAGDDLLVWQRQVDDTVQLLRLEGFFDAGLGAQLQVDSDISGGWQLDAKAVVPPTTLQAGPAAGPALEAADAKAAEAAAAEGSGETLWLSLLVDDLAHADAVWHVLAQRLSTQGATLQDLYVASAPFAPLNPGPSLQDLSAGSTAHADATPPRLLFERPQAMVDGHILYQEAADGVWLQGMAEPGLHVQVRLSQDAVQRSWSVVADRQGRWSLTLPLEDWLVFADGAATLEASTQDASGNRSEVVEQPLDLRLIRPVTPEVALAPASLSGEAGWTNDATPTFEGTGPAGGQVRWVRDANADGQIGADESGTLIDVDPEGQFSLTLPPLGQDGRYQWLVESVDTYGNVSRQARQVTLWLDRQAPQAPQLQAVSADDLVSYQETHQPAGTVLSGSGETGATVELVLSQGGVTRSLVAGKVGSDGQWQTTVSRDVWAAFQDGTLEVSARQTDQAGNSSPALVRALQIRTTPVPEVSSLSLQDGQDTGLDSSDGIVSNAQPWLQITGQANQWVRLLLDRGRDGAVEDSDSVLATLQLDSFGHASWQATPLGEGLQQILALGWDPDTGSYSNVNAATGLVQGVSARLVLTVDTQAPAAPWMDAVTGDDTVIDSEALANVMLTGTAEANAQVTIHWSRGFNDSVLRADASGRWALTLTPAQLQQLGNGTVSLSLQQTDVAGNLGTELRQHTFRMDTSALPAPYGLALAAADDSGRSQTDAVTRQAQVTLTGQAAAGQAITVFADANGNGTLDTGEQLAIVTTDAQGQFSSAVTLAQGSNNLRAIARDLSNNKVSVASVALQAVLDTQISAVSGMVVATDNVINLAERSADVTVSGQAEAGADVTTTWIDGQQQTRLTRTVRVDANGQWIIRLGASELDLLGQGALTLQATQTDAAGNTATAVNATVTVDTLAPTPPDEARLAAASAANSAGELADGLQWSDIQLDAQVLLNVALPNDLGAGATVKLQWGSQAVTHQVTAEELASGLAQVSVSAATIQAQGDGAPVNVTATFVDAAGNEGPWTGRMVQPLTVLSSVPASFDDKPAQMALLDGSYGRQRVDAATSLTTYYTRQYDVTLVFTGLPGGQVLVYEDTDGSGRYTPLAERLIRVQLDGNGQAVAQLSLTGPSHALHSIDPADPHALEYVIKVEIDAQAPLAPVITALDDKINQVERDAVAGTLVQGTAESGADIDLVLTNTRTGVSTRLGTVRADEQGQWQARLGLTQWAAVGDGPLRLEVTQTDWAGNTSAVTARDILLDTVANAPTLQTVSGNDWVGNAQANAQTGVGVDISGGAEREARVLVSIAGAASSLPEQVVETNANGLWSLHLSASQLRALGEGVVTVTAYQIDGVGNRSSASSRTFQIDTQIGAPVIEDMAGDNRIHAVEASQSVLVEGTGEAGASLVLTATHSGLSRQWTVQVGDSGRWQASVSEADFLALGNGNWSLSAQQTDRAGNVSALASRNVIVDLSPVAGAVTVNALNDSGSVAWADQARDLPLGGFAPEGTQVYLVLQGRKGSVTLGPVAVSTTGQWQATLTSDQMLDTLGTGAVRLDAWAVDPVTGRSTQANSTAEYTLVLQAQEPMPTAARVSTDGMVNAQEAASGVVLSGTGEAGHYVTVTLAGPDGQAHRTVQVSQDRSWSWSLSATQLQALGQGQVDMNLVQQSSLSGSGQTSLALQGSFTIDTVAPQPPYSGRLAQANAYNSSQGLQGGVSYTEAAAGVPVAVPLHRDAVSGDKIILMWGAKTVQYTLVDADLQTASAQGYVLVSVPGNTIAQQGSGTVDIAVRMVDQAGNAGSDITLASSVPVQAPPVAPQFDTVMGDGYINLAEYDAGSSQPSGLILSGLAGDGTVHLTLSRVVSGQTLTYAVTTTAQAGVWQVQIPSAQLDLLGEGRVQVSAYLVNSAQVNSPLASSSFVFDKTLPAAVSSDSAWLAEQQNARGELAGGLIAMPDNNNLTEAYGGAVVNVGLPADAQSGDKILLYWGSAVGSGGLQVSYTLTQTDISNQFAAIAVSQDIITQKGDSTQLRVEAQAMDRAGNPGQRYLVWSGWVDAVPGVPTLGTVASDGWVNRNESLGAVTLGGAADAGNTVTVNLRGANGHALQKVAQADAQGQWTVTLDNSGSVNDLSWLGEGTVQVQVVQKDVASIPGMPGNTSAAVAGSFAIDTIRPDAPAVAMVTGDDRVNYVESQAGVQVTGTGEAGAALVLRLSAGATTLTKTAVAVDSTGHWAVQLSSADFAQLPTGALTLSALQTDAAGNASDAGTRSIRYSNQQIAAPTIASVSGVSGTDSWVNQADFDAHGGVVITGSGIAGNSIRLDLNVAGASHALAPITVDGNGVWSRTLTPGDLAVLGQGLVHLQATQIDALSADESVATPFQDFVIDTVQPTLEQATLSANGLRGNAKAGDVITVTVNLSEAVTIAGGSPTVLLEVGSNTRTATYDAQASAQLGSSRAVFTYTVQSTDEDSIGGVTLVSNAIDWAGASVQDLAGNPAGAGIAQVRGNVIRVDTQAPGAPAAAQSIALDAGSVAADAPNSLGGAYINKLEADSGKVVLSVALTGSGALAGDTLRLSWGARDVDVTLTESDITAGQARVSVASAAVGQVESTVVVTAQLIDAAGNLSNLSQPLTVVVDTVAPVALTLNDILVDNRINAQEAQRLLGSGLTSADDVSGSGAVSGATLRAWVQQGSTRIDLGSPVVSGGNWTVSGGSLGHALAQLTDGSVVLGVTQSDAAGNDSTATLRNLYLDRSVPNAPAITSVPQAVDGWINLADATQGVTVNVSLTGTGARAGDKLIVSGWSQDYSLTLSESQIASGQLSVLVPADTVLQAANAAPTSISITARIEDQGGNVSPGSLAVNVQLDTVINAPVVDLTCPVADGVTPVEVQAAGDRNSGGAGLIFSGSGAENGARLVVLMVGPFGDTLRFPTSGDANGNFSLKLYRSDFYTLGSGTIAWSIQQTDAAGNVSDIRSGSYALALSMPSPGFADLTGDNLINATEAASGVNLAGYGITGSTVNLRYFDATDSEITGMSAASKNAAVVAGAWSVPISSADIALLGSQRVTVKATQSFSGNTSDVASLVFSTDQNKPVLNSTVTWMDGNRDGANNDGLLLQFSEPVLAANLQNISAWQLSGGLSLGSAAWVEALGASTINGSTYSQSYRIYLGANATLLPSSVGASISVNSNLIRDVAGNMGASSSQSAPIPTWATPGQPSPPLTIATDNRINASESAGATSISFSHAALSGANYALRVYLDGTQIRSQSIVSGATSTAISLSGLDWGSSLGQKTLVAQIVNLTTGATGAYSSPKAITLDTGVAQTVQLELVSDTGAQGAFNSGDVVELRFGEAVNLTAASLPTAMGGATPLAVDGLKQVGDSSTYASTWRVTLGASSTLTAGQSLSFSGVKDMAGNTATLGTQVRSDVFTPTPSVLINNVAANNVLDAATKSAGVQVSLQLTDAKAGDQVVLKLDGQVFGTATVASNGQTSVSFNVGASSWGGDGERVLQASVVRGGVSAAESMNRSVYVAADQLHWSAVFADTLWFDPDTLQSLKDGAQVTSWVTSSTARDVNGNLVTLTPRVGSVPKITDASGHVALYFNGASSLYSSVKTAVPRADLTGFSDFSTLKLLGYPPAWGYTMTREIDAAYNGKVYGYRHHFGGLNTTLSSHFSGYGINVVANAATVSSWMVSNGYNDTVNQVLAVNNRILSSAPDTSVFASSTKYVAGTFGTVAVGGSGGASSGGAEWVKGVMGDQIAFNMKLNAAMRGEIVTYLAAKYKSEGRLVTPTLAGQTYDLSVTGNATPTIDDLLQLNASTLGTGADTVITAGADHVSAGAGDDVVQVKDLSFRYLDGGLGTDTWMVSNSYNDRVSIVLSDFVSNARALTGSAADNQRVLTAGYHFLTGFERLDLRQLDAVSGAVTKQILTVSAQDVSQLSENNRLEVLLGKDDVLLTSGFAAVDHGHWSVNGNHYDTRYTQTVNGESVQMYVHGGLNAPDPMAIKLYGSALQLDFSSALPSASPLVGDFSIAGWGGTGLVPGLQSIASVNGQQGMYFTFSGALSSPLQMTLKNPAAYFDEYGRQIAHNQWGIGTDGADQLDASRLTASTGWSVNAPLVMMAGAGDDTLVGTSYEDVLIGGLGADTLSGGAGSDRFAYNAVYKDRGGSAGLGGLAGDLIKDFNTSADSTSADILDFSDLFGLPSGQSFAGKPAVDAHTLISGGYIDLLKSNNSKDLQIWVDRDGGGAMGLLVTLKDIGSYTNAVPEETSEQLLQRLLTEGRMQVTHA